MSHTISPVEGLDIARLAVMRRLARGTAHAMNNALTAAMGETSFALDELQGGGDRKVTMEACEAAQTALRRCAQLCRSLSLADQCGASEDEPVDLVRTVRDLERWLDEAIGGAQCLRVDAPDEHVTVAGRPEEIELIVMGLVVYAADRTIGTEVGLRVIPGDPCSLVLDAHAAAMPADSLAPLIDPGSAHDPITAQTLAAFRSAVQELGGEWLPEARSAESWRLTLRLPAA